MVKHLFPLAMALAIVATGWHSAPGADRRDGAPAATGSAADAPDVIVVDPATARRTIPAGFFGINYVGFWDPAQGSPASARALAQTPIRGVRFPGGAPADWYDWQQPYYKGWSRTSPGDLWRYARSFGATRVVFETNDRGHLPDPPGKRYSVNSPENAAAWVSYDRSAGIVADMEVGNEEDLTLLHRPDDPAYGAYVAAFNARARAMHRADPRVRVLGPVAANEYYWWGLDGLGLFLRGAGNRTGSGQVDGIALHFYKGSSWYDARSVAQYWTAPNGPWAAIQRMIRAHDTRNLPVYLTEWNVGAADANNAFTPTLGHALATADVLGALARSGVAGEDYFALHGAAGWGLLYGTGESRPVDSPTPTYYAMVLWGHMGHRLIALSQSDDPARMTSAYATTGERGSVQVLVINKRRTWRLVRLELDGATPRGHRLHLYSLRGVADSIVDRDVIYDGARMPAPQHPLPGPDEAGVVRGDAVMYTVPPYSAVVLDLDGPSPAPRLTRSRRAPPPAAPAPALRISVRGRVGRPAVTGGQVEPLTAVVRSTDDMGWTLVDLEVYDSAIRKAFQATRLVNLIAGTPVTVTQPYTLPTGATGGTYSFRVGVFGPTWSPRYAWSNAGQFAVAGPPPAIITVTGGVSPTAVHAGETVTFTALVSARHTSLDQAIVDLEADSSSGVRLCQRVVTGIDVPKDGNREIRARCTLPAGWARGRDVLKLGVFGPHWSPLYAWNDRAATFSVA